MTRTQAQILELFQTLGQAEKRELAEQLYETAVAGTFFERMTSDQRAALQDGIEQADRAEGISSEDFFNRMAVKHGFTRST
jgi:Mg/Co/Ni transporter MgtE